MDLREITFEEKEPSIINLLDKLSGQLGMLTRTQALAINSCCFCGNEALDFRSDAAHKEYLDSALCQTCQDELYQE